MGLMARLEQKQAVSPYRGTLLRTVVGRTLAVFSNLKRKSSATAIRGQPYISLYSIENLPHFQFIKNQGHPHTVDNPEKDRREEQETRGQKLQAFDVRGSI